MALCGIPGSLALILASLFLMPPAQQAARQRKPRKELALPRATPIFKFRACAKDEDPVSSEKWSSMSIETLTDLVLVWPQKGGAGKPLCYKRSDLGGIFQPPLTVETRTETSPGPKQYVWLSFPSRSSTPEFHLVSFESAAQFLKKHGCYHLKPLKSDQEVGSEKWPLEELVNVNCHNTWGSSKFELGAVQHFCRGQAHSGFNASKSYQSLETFASKLPPACQCVASLREGKGSRGCAAHGPTCFSPMIKIPDEKLCCCPVMDVIDHEIS
eukprot:TRINITY_DN73649_c0_g1_i1.p1 TRINITY_DN73649_c0_g1~~TRINITY_DN73649_c0_g1_i1.p1  ORF type:complete len:291 (+),score=33.26 TRINITY_DN73649_c0_g1_i1:64-873(+)